MYTVILLADSMEAMHAKPQLWALTRYIGVGAMRFLRSVRRSIVASCFQLRWELSTVSHARVAGGLTIWTGTYCYRIHSVLDMKVFRHRPFCR